MTEINISGEKIFVTPIECTMCREMELKSNLICAVFSKKPEINKILCGRDLNYFCEKHYLKILNMVGIKK